jgi:hypothetical protein
MNTTTETSFGKLLGFLDRLDAAGIVHRLAHVRDAVMVELAIPGSAGRSSSSRTAASKSSGS